MTQNDLAHYALSLAGRGVQEDDGHTYNVHARDLADYASTIRELVKRLDGHTHIWSEPREEPFSYCMACDQTTEASSAWWESLPPAEKWFAPSEPTAGLEAQLEDNGSLRVWCPVGVTFPGGTQEFGENGQPTGYAVFWPATTVLNGATNEPAPETEINSAGEFAAYWNTQTPERREEMVQQIKRAQKQATDCFIRDHDNLEERLRWAYNQITTLSANRFCEAYREIDGRACILEPDHMGDHKFSRVRD